MCLVHTVFLICGIYRTKTHLILLNFYLLKVLKIIRWNTLKWDIFNKRSYLMRTLVPRAWIPVPNKYLNLFPCPDCEYLVWVCSVQLVNLFSHICLFLSIIFQPIDNGWNKLGLSCAKLRLSLARLLVR